MRRRRAPVRVRDGELAGLRSCRKLRTVRRRPLGLGRRLEHEQGDVVALRAALEGDERVVDAGGDRVGLEAGPPARARPRRASRRSAPPRCSCPSRRRCERTMLSAGRERHVQPRSIGASNAPSRAPDSATARPTRRAARTAADGRRPPSVTSARTSGRATDPRASDQCTTSGSRGRGERRVAGARARPPACARTWRPCAS